MRRKLGVLFLILSMVTVALTVVIGAVAFPNINQSETSDAGIYQLRKHHWRYWQLLPVDQWGFNAETVITTTGDGVTKSELTERRIGLVALVEGRATTPIKN